MTTRLLTLAIALFAADPKEFHELTGKVVHIADGDTLTVLDSDKVQHKVRLHGIDAPEKGQAFGTKAKEALAEKVHEKNVRVVWKEPVSLTQADGPEHRSSDSAGGKRSGPAPAPATGEFA